MMNKKIKTLLLTLSLVGTTAYAESPTIVERKSTETGGYEIWSDGYKEAWGQYTKSTGVLNNLDEIVINLPFTLTNPSNAYVDGNITHRVGNSAATLNVIGISSTTVTYGPDRANTGNLDGSTFTWTVKGF